MTDPATLTDAFEAHRTHLRSVAYRMLGSLSEADDAVQETWIRVSRAGTAGVEKYKYLSSPAGKANALASITAPGNVRTKFSYDTRGRLLSRQVGTAKVTYAYGAGGGVTATDSAGTVSTLLANADGNIASVHASWTEWRGYRLVLDIYGSRGSIRVSCFPMLVDVVWAGERGGRTRRRRFLFPQTFVMEHLRTYRWVVVQSFVDEFRAFARAVGGAAPSVLATGQDGLRAVEIAEMASDAPMVRAGSRG